MSKISFVAKFVSKFISRIKCLIVENKLGVSCIFKAGYMLFLYFFKTLIECKE